jgi:hypothetical protein
MGLAHFDAWAQMFADTCQSVEMKTDGSGFRVHTKISNMEKQLMKIAGGRLSENG